MRMRLCVRAAVTAGIALGGYLASSAITFETVGFGPAEAAQFYTRKRVNGVWIEGRFPKAERSSRARSSKGSRTASVPRVTQVPPTATHVVLPPLDLRRNETPPPTAAAIPNPREAQPAAVLPDVEAALVAAAVGPVPAADESGIAGHERVVRLRRALEARADELKAKSALEAQPERAPEATASVAVGDGSPVPSPPSSSQAAGAEPRSAPQPAATLPEGSPVAAAASPAEPSKVTSLLPRSISYDFETGMKTTVFANSVVREPFDRALMRSLVAGPLSAR